MQANKLEKETFNKYEVMEYLEEVIQMGLATEEEENIYYDMKYTGKCTYKDYVQVRKNMHKLYNEKF